MHSVLLAHVTTVSKCLYWARSNLRGQNFHSDQNGSFLILDPLRPKRQVNTVMVLAGETEERELSRDVGARGGWARTRHPRPFNHFAPLHAGRSWKRHEVLFHPCRPTTRI